MVQTEAALKRAVEIVQSNRILFEIASRHEIAVAAAVPSTGMLVTKSACTGAASDGTVASATSTTTASISKKNRSAIVVSTASDLNQIVTHAKKLWEKYNATANHKVSWSAVAKELGIHVKVREKYARMHHRAVIRGFDFEKNGHDKIKDHANIFLDPLGVDDKSRAPSNNGITNSPSTTSTDLESSSIDISTDPSVVSSLALTLLSSPCPFPHEHDHLIVVDDERHQRLFEQMEEDQKVSAALTTADTTPFNIEAIAATV